MSHWCNSKTILNPQIKNMCFFMSHVERLQFILKSIQKNVLKQNCYFPATLTTNYTESERSDQKSQTRERPTRPRVLPLTKASGFLLRGVEPWWGGKIGSSPTPPQSQNVRNVPQRWDLSAWPLLTPWISLYVFCCCLGHQFQIFLIYSSTVLLFVLKLPLSSFKECSLAFRI